MDDLKITRDQETQLRNELENTIKRICQNLGPELEAETYIYNKEGELLAVIAF